ncbi:aminotransferase class I/II-fold pyridoxal phosphate-dependent enzyme [Litorihabitans aurantiacus]|uniref:HTH gntR-type domain-containing protein n=1 Tax=Litorihabitans aurantiacus TaxID=1930061 RepID=A0AA37XHH5_9MICO|nr:aminotransferase class I/II-fold pyridoxal phosphate-dependent enzyme [Litorihabitans aurantiacus]GMA33171.1 hypothetical protein GCM10025875_31630 [Litorihabitans aurantiacus]
MAIATAPDEATTPLPSPSQVLADLRGLTPREILAALAARIADGTLPPGSRLPTIRDVAAMSGTSTSSIAAVWARLSERGVISTRRRGGTVVVGALGWPRAGSPRAFTGWGAVDMSSAHPAPEDLPDLRQAFRRSLDEPRTNALAREHITDQLRAVVAPAWPFEAQEWTTVSGSGEATLVTCEAATPAGGTVAVQEPATPGTVGNLRSLGLEVVAVASDEAGPLPASLEAALAAGASTFLYQPDGTLTVDSRLTRSRAEELVEVLQRVAPDAWVIEEDVLATRRGPAPVSLGRALPDRVVRLASYCRAFGLDLRTTVIGGARALLEPIRQLRSHGMQAQSRILQNALAHMLSDPAACLFAESAARQHAAAADGLVERLARLGVRARSSPGSLLVWVPVRDEAQALAELATHGVTLAPSARTFVTAPSSPVLRVGTPQLPAGEPLDELAQLLASAATTRVSDA